MAGFNNPTKRLLYVLDFFRDHKELQQFGQAHSEKSFNGKTGCSFTVCQLHIGLWKGKFPTHNDLAAIVKYPATKGQREGKIGLLTSQVLKIYDHYDLKFRIVRNWSWKDIEERAAKFGPIHLYVGYSYYPEWKGKTYYGNVADGKPNGYARPYEKAGNTQIGSRNFAHSTSMAGFQIYRDSRGNVDHVTDYMRDPNHGSKVRPERPSYDKMFREQGAKLYLNYAKVPGVTGGAAAIIPMEVFNGTRR